MAANDFSSNNPQLAEVIEIAFQNLMAGVNTMMPATVVSYDPTTQSAVVQPGFMSYFSGAGQAQALPTIARVPVLFQAAGGAWLRFPVNVGDPLMLIFSQRALDNWWANGGITDPESPVKFDLNDAAAIPGLNPKGSAIVPKGASSSVELAYGSLWIELTKAGKVKITNGTVEVMAMIDDLMTQLSTAECPTEGGPLIMPGLAALQALWDTLKA